MPPHHCYFAAMPKSLLSCTFVFLALCLLVSGEKERAEDESLEQLTSKLWHEIEKRLGEDSGRLSDSSRAMINQLGDELQSLDSCVFNSRNASIVRTHDSQEAGAVFLNSIDSDTDPDLSLDSCQEACCSSDNCNLAVFKNKEPNHSCYLFDCGSPSVCVFTEHPGFSTHMLPSRNTGNKEQEKHADDLENLAAVTSSTSTTEPTTTTSTQAPTHPPKVVKNPVPLFDECEDHKDCAGSNTECLGGYCLCQEGFHAQGSMCRKDCKRFEFECANEGQPAAYPSCIAIYDKCDGTIHCSDGSDELNCDATDTQGYGYVVPQQRPAVPPSPLQPKQPAVVPQPVAQPIRPAVQPVQPIPKQPQQQAYYDQQDYQSQPYAEPVWNYNNGQNAQAVQRGQGQRPVAVQQPVPVQPAPVYQRLQPQPQQPPQPVAPVQPVYQPPPQQPVLSASPSVAPQIRTLSPPVQKPQHVVETPQAVYKPQAPHTVGRKPGPRKPAYETPVQPATAPPDNPVPQPVPSYKPVQEPSKAKTGGNNGRNRGYSNYGESDGGRINGPGDKTYHGHRYNTGNRGYKMGNMNSPYNSDSGVGRPYGNYAGYANRYNGQDYRYYDTAPSLWNGQNLDYEYYNLDPALYQGAYAAAAAQRDSIKQSPLWKSYQNFIDSYADLSEDSTSSSVAPTSPSTSLLHPSAPAKHKSKPKYEENNKPEPTYQESNEEEDDDNVQTPPPRIIDHGGLIAGTPLDTDTDSNSSEEDNEGENDGDSEETGEEVISETGSDDDNNNSVEEPKVESPASDVAIEPVKSENKVIAAVGSQGAVIALALGLALTAILLVFVGCRLRRMKHRIRKGRPLNSNEADYLINGMYL